ncbi:MAG: protein translocase subunit SecD [Puniceicoccales bacterium]|jgi:SecD/SecF fusion protein|nr:protein translocase subunit SecD [Puniceicoccales bacterium]
MSKKIFWFLFVSVLFLAYALHNLTPLTTTPFDVYVQKRNSSRKEEFKQIIAEANERVAAQDNKNVPVEKKSQTIYSALRDIGAGKGKTGKAVDLHQFFDDILLIKDPNIIRRNDFLLQELLRQSQGKLKLGLDLQGGISFTLRIDPKVFEVKQEDIAEAKKVAIRDTTKGLVNPNDPSLSETQKKNAAEKWAKALKEAEEVAKAAAKEKAESAQVRLKEGLDRAVAVMEGRVNAFGVAEPLIRILGTDSIEIQLPGPDAANNPDAINSLKKPAKLEFRMVHRYLTPEPGERPHKIVALPENPSDKSSPVANYEVLYLRREDARTGNIHETPLYVQKTAVAAGNIVSKAEAVARDSLGNSFQTSISFTSAGSKKFEELTGRIAEENNRIRRARKDFPELALFEDGRMAIVLDGELVLAPGIKINDDGVYRAIAGGATIDADSYKGATELANVLNNPLEFPLELMDSKQIGASLAEDAKQKSINAATWGIGLVLVFMLAYYLWAGAIAVVGLTLNVVLMLGVMATIGATITLPGIAALVLTVGMAVDANILIFERIREELADGKTFKAAVHSGYDRAQATIIDVNLTSLMSAGILIWTGTGPVKGFGVILAIGLVTTVFTSLVTCRALQELCVAKGWFTSIFGIRIFKGNTEFKFLDVAKRAFLISWGIAIVSIGALFYKGGDAFSKDFKGGEAAIVKVAEGKEQISTGDIIKAANEAGVSDVTTNYQSALGGSKEMTLRIETELSANVKVAPGTRQLADFTQVNKAVEAVRAKYPDRFPQGDLNAIVIGRESVGGAVSEGLQRNAILSMFLALVGIAIYVALRFEAGMGLGAFVSSLHDVLLTCGLYILVGKQFSIAMIAAVLMVIGYSINDTIVVFDRIREELKRHPGMSLRDIVHFSINRTLSRTLLTSITIFLTALALWLLGAGDVKEYGLIFVFGVITGTFSSIYIASPIFYWWHKGRRDSVEKAEAKVHYEWEAGTEIKKKKRKLLSEPQGE